MNERDIALEVKGLSKSYHVASHMGERTIHALQEVEFTVQRGSCLGIVGRNGCGKTTLLKVIGGLVRPTKGTIEINGVLLAITDVGGGFLPDLTGLENIRLNARMYGLSEDDVDRIIPLVARFSEIEEFFNIPVKNFSQGMFLRLAFSTMIHLPVDIVLLDEVLAVGDVAFRAKCFGKLRELSAQGLTVLMVSHTYDEIAAFCDKCLVLDSGNVIALGRPDETFTAYQETSGALVTSSDSTDEPLKAHFEHVKPGYVEIEEFSISPQGATGAMVRVTEPIEIRVQWTKAKADCTVAFHISISDEMGRAVIDTANYYAKTSAFLEQRADEGQRLTDICIIPKNLLNSGIFLVKLSVTACRSVDDYFTVLETVKPFPLILYDDPSEREHTFWTFSSAPVRTPFHWSRQAVTKVL